MSESPANNIIDSLDDFETIHDSIRVKQMEKKMTDITWHYHTFFTAFPSGIILSNLHILKSYLNDIYCPAIRKIEEKGIKELTHSIEKDWNLEIDSLLKELVKMEKKHIPLNRQMIRDQQKRLFK